jgi:hypothetical protein
MRVSRRVSAAVASHDSLEAVGAPTLDYSDDHLQERPM